jgi:DNA polymerase III epsilon subunit-like protein
MSFSDFKAVHVVTKMVSVPPVSEVDVNFPVPEAAVISITISESEPPHLRTARRNALIDNIRTHPIYDRPFDLDMLSQTQLDELALLEYCVLPKRVMKRYPFVTTALSLTDMLDKRRCENCKKLPRYNGKSLEPPKKETETLFCKYHPGRMMGRRWGCCGGSVGYTQGCSGLARHTVLDVSHEALIQMFQLELTAQVAPENARPAVAVDCEMGTAINGESELIRVSVTDMSTRKILLNTLVYPSVPMEHYNTKYSGVTRAQMEEARRNKQCLKGTPAARAAVLQWIGPQTIVVGHSVWNDFAALRWIHPRVVDTHVLEDRFDRMQKIKWEPIEEDMKTREFSEEQIKEAKEQYFPPLPKGAGGLGLKGASLRRLGRIIQAGHGHCSLEDALATGDLAQWHALNPGLFDYVW